MAKPRLSFKKTPRSKGLARVCEGELGYDLRIDGIHVGGAKPLLAWSAARTKIGYYWWVKSIGAIKHKNTADAPVATMEEAQAQCLAYVRKCLDDAGSAK
jgi:hypothetical protein